MSIKSFKSVEAILMHSNVKFVVDNVSNFVYNIEMVHNNTHLKGSNNNKNKENFNVNV